MALLVGLSGPASGLPLVKNPLSKSKGDGKFHVVGTQIVGPAGGTFVPRGVNIGGLEQTSKGYDVAYWNYKRMKSWGVNFVRVALSDTFWLKSMCTYDATYQAKVDQIVKWGEQLKMLVLLDDHNGTRGQTCGQGKWFNLERSPDIHNLTFVKQLGTRYKGKPYVAIDLYNEPHDISDDVWRNGGVVDGYRAVGMQQLLDGVRSTGFDGIVMATGNFWGQDLRMIVDNPLSPDRNVVYGAHEYPYWCGARLYSRYEPFGRCNGHLYSPYLDTHIPQALSKRAVMLSEFGTQRPIAAEVAEPIQWAEDHHIGWAAWLWCNGEAANYCLLSADGGSNPSVIGQPVRDALHRATGA
jgi:hypothetical protein